jgi:hypothetical protein
MQGVIFKENNKVRFLFHHISLFSLFLGNARTFLKLSIVRFIEIDSIKNVVSVNSNHLHLKWNRR